MKYLWAFLGCAILIGGCASVGVNKDLERDDVENYSFVYGYAANFPKGIGQEVWYKWIVPKLEEDRSYNQCRVDDGYFYDEEARPATYRLSNFCWTSDHGYWSTPRFVRKNLRLSPNMPLFTIHKGGELYFMGSYKINDDDSVTRIGHPSEKEVLEKILPHAQGKKWAALIEKRIQELSR